MTGRVPTSSSPGCRPSDHAPSDRGGCAASIASRTSAPFVYLSGVVRPELVGTRPDLGLMLTPMMGNVVDLTAGSWGADNGRFASPEKFTLPGFLGWLRARAHAISTCLFATAPDVLGDPRATWELSRDALPLIRAAGFPAALVAQDGMLPGDVCPSTFDVLFIGGTPAERGGREWKLSHHALALVSWARAHGKRAHMGRVNSLKRMQAAASFGCDSADGTFLRVAPDINVPRLLAMLDTMRRQPVMVWSA